MVEDIISDPTLSGGTVLPPEQAAFDVVQEETRSVQYLDWLGGKLFPAIGQGIAITAVVMSGLISPWATPIASIGMFAFELGRAYFRNQADLKRELALYHEDIAHALGKSPEAQLTIDDMRKAADEKYVGDKAIKPLEMELNHLKYRSRYNYLMGAGRAATTMLGAFAMGGMISHVRNIIELREWTKIGSSLFMPLTGALAAVGTVTFGFEKLGKNYFDSHKPLSVYKELVQLQETAKRQPIEPGQVFSITVLLDKPLAQDIRNHFGKPYEQLTHINKEHAIKAYEDKVHAATIAQHINNGTMPVTAVALSAFHQIEWPESTPATKVAPESTMRAQSSSLTGSVEKSMQSFVAALMDEMITSIESSRER